MAAPQLAAAARGDFTAAQAMQADVAHVRPYVLAVRSREAALQARIAAAQQMTTDRLIHAQAWLLGALVGLCVVVAAFAADALIGVTIKLLRPFRALRQAVDAVAHGQHGTRIPVMGPAELADLGRSTELMRIELVAALAERERAEQRFRRLFDAAPDAMIAVAPDGSIAMANTQAVRLFGYPAPDLLGSPGGDARAGGGAGVLAAERTSTSPTWRPAHRRPAEYVRAAPGRRHVSGRDQPERAADRKRDARHGRDPGRLGAAGHGERSGNGCGPRRSGSGPSAGCSSRSGWKAWASWSAGSRTTSTTCST